MKALKEKRISLRSLWRRGLVILSLFALVFASCADTDKGGGAETPSGPALSSIEIVQSPADAAKLDPANAKAYNSYEGLPVNLKGLQVLLKYDSNPKDNRVITLDNSSAKFYTEPSYAVGFLAYDASNNNVWYPMVNYTLIVEVGGKPWTANLKIPNVIPISRAESWTKVQNGIGNGYKYADDPELFWSQGLKLTGSLTEKLYVDDFPTLSKYVLQARYSDGEDKDIPLGPDSNWAIRPRYDNGLDKTGKGDLLVIVGKNPLTSTDPRVTASPHGSDTIGAYLGGPTTKIDPALTAPHMYEQVYHVKSIEIISGDELKPFFYWYDDGTEAWIDRLIKANTKLRVNYTDGAPKEFTVQEATWMNDVWYNRAPEWVSVFTPFGVKGIKDSSVATNTYPDGLPHSRNRKPLITLNYRGGTTTIDVPVYTRLVGLNVTPKAGGDMITVDMRKRDNDVGGMNATAFAALIDVVATFQTASGVDPVLTKDLILDFNENFFHDQDTLITNIANGDRGSYREGVPINFDVGVSTLNTWTTASRSTVQGFDAKLVPTASTPERVEFLAKLGSSYSMSFGKPSYFDEPYTDSSGTYANKWNPDYALPVGTGIQKPLLPVWEGMSDKDVWGFGVCDQARNNDRDVAIVFYYRPPVGDDITINTSAVYGPWWGVTSATTRQQRLTVHWTHIHSK